MKRILGLLWLVGMAVCIMGPSELLAKDEKIVFVNPRKIVDEYQRTKEFEKDFGKELKKGQEELDKRTDEIRRLKDELELLSEEAKKEKEEKIDKKIQELRQVEKETKDNLVKMRDSTTREILKEIDDVIKENGEQKQYSLVLNGRMVLYSNGSLDISDEIVTILNQRYKKNKEK